MVEIAMVMLCTMQLGNDFVAQMTNKIFDQHKQIQYDRSLTIL